MTLTELLNKCKDNINSEIAFQEIVAEHDKQIRADVIDECIKLQLDMSCVEDCIHLEDCTECMAEKMKQLKEQK